MRNHCPTWRVETPTRSAISSRVRPSSLQSTAESRWKTRRSWARRRRSRMSFRCWGVNRVVFITPSHHPYGSDHQGVPPLSPSAIVGSSGPARLYFCLLVVLGVVGLVVVVIVGALALALLPLAAVVALVVLCASRSDRAEVGGT